MKRLYSLFLLISLSILFSSSVISQDRCPYKNTHQPANRNETIVGNFTITDTQGNVYDLYETLDSGKTVFIDLFFTTCSWCQTYAPIIEQIYQNTGAGEEDILMWGISSDPDDTNPVIDQYKSNFNVTNPCAGPQGGGEAAHNTIVSGQTFLGWPTYCVICPDRTMFFDPVYPPTVNGFNTYFAQCAAVVGIENIPGDQTTHFISVFPNPAQDELKVDINLDKSSRVTLELFDLTGSRVLIHELQVQAGRNSHLLDLSKLPHGYYFLKLHQDGIFMDIKSVIIL